MTGSGLNERRPTRISGRTSAALVVALAAGLAIAFIDSRPGWDDTGITAAMLFLGAAVAATIGRDRPWLWALLVGLPTPIVEATQLGVTSSWPAVVFAFAGAYAGWAAARAGR